MKLRPSTALVAVAFMLTTAACGADPTGPDDGPTALTTGVMMERAVSGALGDLLATTQLRRVPDPATDAVPCDGTPGQISVGRTFDITGIPAETIPGSLRQIRDVLVGDGWTVDRDEGTEVHLHGPQDGLAATYSATPDAISVVLDGPCVPDDRDQVS